MTCAPGLPDGEPEPDRSEPVGPAVEQDAGCEATRVRSAVPPEQPEEEVAPQAGEAPGEAIASGETPRDDGPVTLPEPQPVAAADGMSRPEQAIRQSALLTHADLAPAAEDDPPAAQAVFTVNCLGPFELRFGATPVAGWPIAKSRELLAFLATQGGRPVPRESVAEALWPDSPWDASLRHTIANAVSSLRGVVRSAAGSDELQPVVTARQRYELQTALFRIDLDEFESALRRAAALADVDALAEYERAAALCRGDFLEGEPFPWLDAYRADYRRRAADGASRGAAIAERLGERERAALLYGVVLEQDPTDEAAARGRMRHLAAFRDTNGVRKVFKALTEALQRELDDPRAAPAHDTRELLAELLAPGAGSGGVTGHIAGGRPAWLMRAREPWAAYPVLAGAALVAGAILGMRGREPAEIALGAGFSASSWRWPGRTSAAASSRTGSSTRRWSWRSPSPAPGPTAGWSRRSRAGSARSPSRSPSAD